MPSMRSPSNMSPGDATARLDAYIRSLNEQANQNSPTMSTRPPQVDLPRRSTAEQSRLSSLERKLNLVPAFQNGVDAATSEHFNTHSASEFTVPTCPVPSPAPVIRQASCDTLSSSLYVPQHPVAIVTPPTQHVSKIGFVPSTPFLPPMSYAAVHSPAYYASPLVGHASSMLQSGIGLPQGVALAAMMSPPGQYAQFREPVVFSPPPFAFPALASGVLSPPADIYPGLPPMSFGPAPDTPQFGSPQNFRRQPVRSPKNSGPMVKREGDWRCDRCRYLNWQRRVYCGSCHPFAAGNEDIAETLCEAAEVAKGLACDGDTMDDLERKVKQANMIMRSPPPGTISRVLRGSSPTLSASDSPTIDGTQTPGGVHPPFFSTPSDFVSPYAPSVYTTPDESAWWDNALQLMPFPMALYPPQPMPMPVWAPAELYYPAMPPPALLSPMSVVQRDPNAPTDTRSRRRSRTMLGLDIAMANAAEVESGPPTAPALIPQHGYDSGIDCASSTASGDAGDTTPEFDRRPLRHKRTMTFDADSLSPFGSGRTARSDSIYSTDDMSPEGSLSPPTPADLPLPLPNVDSRQRSKTMHGLRQLTVTALSSEF